MTLTLDDVQELLRTLEEHPELRSRFSMLLLADELYKLPDQFRQLREIVTRLAEAQWRTEERVEQLAEAQRRTEEQVQALATRVEELTEAQRRTEEQVQALAARVEELAEAQRRTEQQLEQLTARVDALTARVDDLTVRMAELTTRVDGLTVQMEHLTEEVRKLTAWQYGEAGRREGERYEALLVRRAPALFNGGEGGSPDVPLVQRRLVEKLKPVMDLGELSDDENPFLADLIWWKDEHFVVVEASIQVNGTDVRRAKRRAETLRRAKLTAIGMVVGDEWATYDVRDRAKAEGVAWKVGDDFSEEWLEFRRL